LNLAFETFSRGGKVREDSVQKISTATASIIVLIALYFTLSWGYEALRILTSPSYGFEDVSRSQFLFGIGRVFDLSPTGLIKLAAFFATLKLAVACICALHIADRARCFMRGQPNSEILEAGLILVVMISIASVGFDARAYLSVAVCRHCDRPVHIRTYPCTPCRNVGSQAAARLTLPV
jgi:hypothetical protein